MPQFTDQQLAAIEARGTDLLVSAAAGSGKTTVLVARVLKLIEEGVDIDRILIVTFTRAAAADMREKLQRRLEELSAEDKRFRDQLDKLPGAAIGTIHSFCTSIMRENFEAAGVDPAFRIMDSAEADKLQAQTLRKAMDDIYSRGGEGLTWLTCGRNAQAVADTAVELYRFARNRPDPWEWLRQSVDSCACPEHMATCRSLLEDDVKAALNEALALYRQALQLCMLPNGPMHYAAALQADMAQIESLLLCEGEALPQAIALFTQARPGRGKSDEALAEAMKALRKKAGDRVARSSKLLIELPRAQEDMALSQKAYACLVELVMLFDSYLNAEKDGKAAYDYSDLEQRALRAMSKQTVCQAIADRFDAVFVDEYQDVSDLQQALLRKTAKPGQLFCVGDVKQSIYRFRLAEPTLFLHRQEAYAREEGGRLIRLNRNFRSRTRILQFVNTVFGKVFALPGSEIHYTEEEALYPGAAWPDDDPPIEIALLPTGKEAEDEEQAPMSTVLQEGLFVAQRISSLVGTPLLDPSTQQMRTVRYSDIVVLARTRNRLMAVRDVLSAAGIPCFADASGGYTETMEVRHVLTLLSVIDNVQQDTDLLAALLSPVFAFTAEEVAEIRVQDKESTLYAAAKAYAQQDNGLAKKLQRFFDTLSRYRLFSRSMPLHTFIELLLRESGFSAYVGALPEGEKRGANLALLCDMASRFDTERTGGLHGFLDSFRMPSGSGSDYGEAQPLGEGDDVVRLMTAHKSKGLEFPIVFGIQMERDYTRNSTRGEFAAHRALGFALPLHDPSLGSKRTTIRTHAIRSLANRETINEELRLLYVLMTRASDRLILVGSLPPKKAETLMTEEKGDIRSVRSWLDALMPCVGEEDPAQLVLHTHPCTSLSADPGCAEASLSLEEQFDQIVHSDEPVSDALTAAYQWEYPSAAASLRPLKLTVTSLSHRLEGPIEQNIPEELPSFLNTQPHRAMARGTATHAALCAIRFQTLQGLTEATLQQAVATELDRLAAQEILRKEDRAVVSDQWIVQFLLSPLGQRMLSAQVLQREWSFNLQMQLRQALPDSAEDAPILVQGVIDCAFLEQGKWVLIDYKTDKEADPDALIQRYGSQVRLYKRALEEITGVPVAESYLCHLRTGNAYRV